MSLIDVIYDDKADSAKFHRYVKLIGMVLLFWQLLHT